MKTNEIDRDLPILKDYYTAKEIRNATAEETQDSRDAAQTDGGSGVIDVDGRSCYVEELAMKPTPCIHGDGTNLYPDCQEDYNEDPTAWEEYGHHATGIANTQDLLKEIASQEHSASAPQPPDAGNDIPY